MIMMCQRLRTICLASFFLLCPAISYGAERPLVDPLESVCALIESASESWRTPHVVTDAERKIFVQCAFEMTRHDDINFSLRAAREIFAPYLLPRAMEDALHQTYDIKRVNNLAKLEFAGAYFARNQPIQTQQSAVYWLTELVLSRSPCMIQAMYVLGSVLSRPVEEQVIKRSAALSYLMIAAQEHYPPAMIVYGEYLLSEGEDNRSVARGFGFLLAAKELGETKARAIEDFRHGLTAGQLKDARIQSDIILNGTPSADYRDCGN